MLKLELKNLVSEWPSRFVQSPVMITLLGSPHLQKGTIIGLDPFNPLASVVVFQYNPLTRTCGRR